jgi:cytochrome P450
MTRDEEVYPDPESFKPERFMKDGALNKEIRDPRDIVFGFGRRYVLYEFHWIVLKG